MYFFLIIYNRSKYNIFSKIVKIILENIFHGLYDLVRQAPHLFIILITQASHFTTPCTCMCSKATCLLTLLIILLVNVWITLYTYQKAL